MLALNQPRREDGTHHWAFLFERDWDDELEVRGKGLDVRFEEFLVLDQNPFPLPPNHQPLHQSAPARRAEGAGGAGGGGAEDDIPSADSVTLNLRP